jgi:tRNA 2-selenouridine synthase
MLIQNHSGKVYVLAGLTGSGKSDLIRHFKKNGIQALDLEALCCHDGSVFSPLSYDGQPTSYQFHKQLLKVWKGFDLEKPVFIESELKRIGNLNLPEWLVEVMGNAKLIMLDTHRSIRRERLSKIIETAKREPFTTALNKLAFKLGEEKLGQAIGFYSLEDFFRTADVLMDYYDSAPGYSFPNDRIKFSIEISEWNPIDITERILNKILSVTN